MIKDQRHPSAASFNLADKIARQLADRLNVAQFGEPAINDIKFSIDTATADLMAQADALRGALAAVIKHNKIMSPNHKTGPKMICERAIATFDEWKRKKG